MDEDICAKLEVIASALVRRNELLEQSTARSQSAIEKMTELASHLVAPRREPEPSDLERRRNAIRTAITFCNDASIELNAVGQRDAATDLEDVRLLLLSRLRTL